MSKIYITKAKLEELLYKHYKDHSDYPKPLLFILTAVLTILAIIAIIVLTLIIFVGAVIYAFLFFWIDLVLGKYVIKRIFK